MKKIALGIASALLFFAFSAFAAVIRVPQDQQTIQMAIDSAANGDTVLVEPGTYAEHIDFKGKGILVKSRAGADSTIIRKIADGFFLVRMLSGEPSSAILDGFTLIGSSTVAVDMNSDGVIRNNIITGNAGGGIACLYGYPKIERNLIVSNGGSYGIYVYPCNGVPGKVENNSIAYNNGVGLYIDDGLCTSTFLIRNNIVFSNSSYGIYARGGVHNLKYNCVFANTPGNYFGILPGLTDISVNPLFVGGSPFDYHLQSHSPCIDAGDPSTPVPPKGGTRVDIGAFEFELGPAFTLISPANSNVEITQTPTLVWHKLADSFTTTQFSYLVIYDDTISFTSPDYSPSSFDTSYQVSPPLPYGKTFYWKVRAVDDSAQLVYSKDTRTFKIDTPPTIPTDISPDSGDVLDFNDYLIWLEGSDPDPGDNVIYQLQIDDDPAFANPEVDQGGITGNNSAGEEKPAILSALSNAIAIQLKNLTNHTNLKDDSAYFWRVRSIDNHGLGSNYTAGTRSFTLNLQNTAPNPVPGGFSPAGNQIVANNHPNMSWFAATDPDTEDTPATLQYNIRLDTDGEIANNFRFQYTTSPGSTSLPVPDSLQENAQWYCAVRTVDSKGGRSAFSSVQNFRVNGHNQPPQNFSLFSPATNGKLFSKTPNLDWADAADPDPDDSASYVVIMANDSNFQFSFSSGQLFSSSYTVGSGLLSRGQQYFWKVKATDNNNLNTFSNEVFKFRVLQLGDANGDGSLTSADIVLILNFVFLGIPITPSEVADMNCDSMATSSDVVLALNAIFLGQPPPCDP